MNIAMAGFDTITGQITELSHQKKQGIHNNCKWIAMQLGPAFLRFGKSVFEVSS